MADPGSPYSEIKARLRDLYRSQTTGEVMAGLAELAESRNGDWVAAPLATGIEAGSMRLHKS